MITVRSSTLVLVGILALAGCKKTEEGESKRWERALQGARDLAATHPGFSEAIAQQRTAAEAAMKAAREVSDKKARIEAMSKANRMLDSGFIGELRDADTKIKKLRQDLVDLAGDVKTEGEKAALAEARRQAERALSTADRAMRAGAKTADAAAAVMSKVKNELDFAKKTLASVSKRVSKRATDKAAADKAAADKAAADKAAADQAVADWTCSYCDHKNKHDATKCANCGADKSPK